MWAGTAAVVLVFATAGVLALIADRLSHCADTSSSPEASSPGFVSSQARAIHSISISKSIGQEATGTNVHEGGLSGQKLAKTRLIPE